VVCGSPLFGAGHADVLSSSMEDVVEEEVIASGSAAGGGGGTYCEYADGKGVARFLDAASSSAAYGEPLSLVMDRTSLPVTSDAETKLEPLRTFYSHEDENYYLEPRPPRNADSAPPSFGGT